MRRHKPRILVDIDGVFSNFIAGSLPTIKEIVLQRPNVRCPSNDIEHENAIRWSQIEHEDIHSYRMEEVFDLTPYEIQQWHEIVRRAGYCEMIPPYDGAREAIAELQKLGDVHPVTFPWPKSPWWIIEREAWLRERLGIDPSLVVYTQQKHLVAGDIFVEDTTKYLIQWREHFPDGVAIRVQRPYNVREPFPQGITVKTFVELVQEVRSAVELSEQHQRSLWDAKGM